MSEQPTSQSLRTLPFAQPTYCRRYEGRVAIVTGAAQGSAASLPSGSPRKEQSSSFCDIQEERLAVAARELCEETGMPFLAVAGDLCEPGVADHVVERALDAYGQIDTLVNNAAALIRVKLVDFTEELMQKAVHWNVWNTCGAARRCCRT